MNHKYAFIFAASVAMGTSLSANAQIAGPYTPEQVYSAMYDAIRQAVGVYPTTPGQSAWVSLSTIGSIVNPNDPGLVNDLANFCPPASPVIAAYGREPKLDAVYERLIEGSIGPVRTYSPSYYQARSYLFKADGSPTKELQAYRDKKRDYVKAWIAFSTAITAADRNLAQLDMNNALQDWGGAGFRAAVDNANNITSQEEYVAGATRQARRRDDLLAYRNLGIQGTDVLGAFVSPASTFSPAPSTWATSTGWVSVSMAADQSLSQYNHTESQRSGFGGISLGFVTIGGSGGGSQTTDTKVTRVYKFSYQFELMRAKINRPWIDTTLLFEPLDWTWKKNPATKDFPHVAEARNGDGAPVPPAPVVYDNKPVDCALYPIDVLIARNRKITATMAKTDYAYVQSSSNASAGGGFFGIFGGAGKQNFSSTQTNDDGTNVTFTIQADGIAVIGLISQFVPRSPNPNLADKWPAEAWLPAAPKP